MISFSLIIPCYNESLNIPLIIQKIKESVVQSSVDPKNIEVLLVNNGSTDDSAAVLERELQTQKLPYIRSILVPENKGYGYGILQGLAQSQGTVKAWTHADMQTNPLDVFSALELYNKHADEHVFIKGKRKNRKWAERFFTWGMQCLASSVLHVPLKDINAQPKLFSHAFYEAHVKDHAPHDFSLDLFVLYQAQKHCSRVLEIPVYFHERTHGEAKGGGSLKTRITLIKRTIAFIFSLKHTLAQDRLIQKK